MNLNSQGKLAKFYMWLPPDDKRLPQDLCTFFWGLVARAFFIFGACGVALFAILFAIVWVALYLWAHKVGTLYGAAFIVFMCFIGWLLNRKQKFELFSEARAVIRAKVDSVKGRYCPRINWK